MYVHVTFSQTGTMGVVPRNQIKLRAANKGDSAVRVRVQQQGGRVGELSRARASYPATSRGLFPQHSLLEDEEQAWLRARITRHTEALNIIV